MGSQLNPYLHFTGQAREALTFYQGVFGGRLDIMTFGQGGMEGAPADLVMHGQLISPAGFWLMAADTPEGMGFEVKPGSNMTISLSGDDPKLRDYFNALADGGQVLTPMAKQMWGDEYGDLVDKFGFRWLVDLSAPSAETSDAG